MYCTCRICGEILDRVRSVLVYLGGLGYGGQVQQRVLGRGVLAGLANLRARPSRLWVLSLVDLGVQLGWPRGLVELGRFGSSLIAQPPRLHRVDQEPDFGDFISSGLASSHLVLFNKGHVHQWAFQHWVAGSQGISLSIHII